MSGTKVTEVLKEAAADGRLSMDELDERLTAALQAKTYADLDPVGGRPVRRSALADGE